MIQRRYRRDYAGEFVVINTDIRLGIKQQRREWIDNPFTAPLQPGRAAVIGSSCDREQFDHVQLQRPRPRGQTKFKPRLYGTGKIWKDMQLDVYCSTDRMALQDLQQTDYHKNSQVLTSSRGCLMFPGSFYLIPFQPPVGDLAAAIYLAAFDGHEDIFLFGYSNDTVGGNRGWQREVAEVIATYHTHNFVFIGGEANMPDAWRELENTEFWNHKKLLTHGNF